MKITSITRDHRETFTSKHLRPCERFVGKDHDADEVGIDDQYTLFYYSSDVPPELKDWVYDNRYSIWHLVDDIECKDFDDFICIINEKLKEWMEEQDEPFEPLARDSKDSGGLFG